MTLSVGKPKPRLPWQGVWNSLAHDCSRRPDRSSELSSARFPGSFLTLFLSPSFLASFFTRRLCSRIRFCMLYLTNAVGSKDDAAPRTTASQRCSPRHFRLSFCFLLFLLPCKNRAESSMLRPADAKPVRARPATSSSFEEARSRKELPSKLEHNTPGNCGFTMAPSQSVEPTGRTTSRQAQYVCRFA